VNENAAALLYLADPRVHLVSFEAFTNETMVVETMARAARFLGIRANSPRLLMTLLPPSAKFESGQHCQV
jgi:hypothetical protein